MKLSLLASAYGLLLPLFGGWLMMTALCQGQTLYSFGNPTAEEQAYVEFINRARANPPAEGARFATTTDPDVVAAYAALAVDLTMMQGEFNAIAAQPPLAPNACLTTSARGHTAWMLATANQSHDETNPSNTFLSRITAAGYPIQTVAENINAYVASVWFGHVGLDVDWGYGTGGMQDPRGHRAIIHSPVYREIGVGVVIGSNGPIGANPAVGPQLVTQDFGTQVASPTFGTGVAYYDLNANNSYDVGEGIAGLTVNVSGASAYCTTAVGGGWVVPVPSTAATRTVSFTGLNMNQSVSLVVPASTNAKADLKLTYAPPQITSSASTAAGSPYTLSFAAVAGATAYKWTRYNLVSAAAENCESTATLTASTTGTYPVLNTSVQQQGAASWNLENPTGTDQSLQLNALYYGQSSPALAFQSRIALATSAELFKVQVKEEGTSNWLDVYCQAGSNGFGEPGFTLRSAALGAMTGKTFRIRFLLNSTGGFFQVSPGTACGWFIDAITFSGLATVENAVTQTLTATSGSFTPSGGTYLMSVTPVISARDFPSSSQVLTATSGQLATVTLGSLAATYNGSPKGATATTMPAGLTVTFTYDGSPTPPTNAGSYAVLGTVSDATYQGSASATLVISKAAATVTLGGLTATYSGGPKSATASTVPVGLTVCFTYNGSGTAPTNAGSYAIVGTIGDPNYQGGASGTLVISKAAATVTLGSLTATYNGGPKPATASTVPAGSTVSFTYNGTAAAPVNVGSYAVVGTISDPNYQGSASGTLVISAIPAILSQPVSTTISKNTCATIAVAACGSSLTFQWYVGNTGVTTNPIAGATAASYTTPTLTKATNYWVRVSNAAGSVNSITSVISVSTGTVTHTFATWAAEIETANSLAAGTISNAGADFDHDGRSNLIEYAFGTLPTVANDPAPHMPVASTTATSYVLRYQRDTSLTDITFTAQACTSLGTWLAPGDAGAPSGFTDTLVSTSGTLQTREAKIPRSTGGNEFMRVRVTRP